MSAHVPAAACRKACADIFNITDHPDHAAVGPEADLIDFWLNHVRKV